MKASLYRTMYEISRKQKKKKKKKKEEEEQQEEEEQERGRRRKSPTAYTRPNKLCHVYPLRRDPAVPFLSFSSTLTKGCRGHVLFTFSSSGSYLSHDCLFGRKAEDLCKCQQGRMCNFACMWKWREECDLCLNECQKQMD